MVLLLWLLLLCAGAGGESVGLQASRAASLFDEAADEATFGTAEVQQQQKQGEKRRLQQKQQQQQRKRGEGRRGRRRLQ